jgi:hypothetical protein
MSSIKRSLLERWRQIGTEGTRGLGFFLATIDINVSANALKEMLESRIYLVVPQAAKASVECYADAKNVITFEDFFEDYLDPAIKRWERANAI